MSKPIQKKVLIIKTGSALDTLLKNPEIKDFSDMIIKKISHQKTYKIDNEIIDVTKNASNLPNNIENYLAIIIHGSPSMVTDHLPWSEKTAEWIKNTVVPTNKPLLGICYGHQLICHSLGGEVGFNPNGKEVGALQLLFEDTCKEDKLFKSFLGQKHYVSVTHSQSIIKAPDFKDFYILAKSDCDSFEAVHFTGNCWGVQFHPEFAQKATEEYEKEEHTCKLAPNYIKDSYKFVNEEFGNQFFNNFIELSIKLLD